VNAIAALVLFVSVIVCAALVFPMSTVPKLSVDPGAGDTAKVGISVSLATKAAEVAPLGKLGWTVPGGKTGKVADEENVTPVI
jgi:hypothetical protein